ncbi:MAG: DUF2922 domain-containing protein [Clostridiales bacterium]|nr:DUF2922 domain-containing protein [Clostridiales bacterium]
MAKKLELIFVNEENKITKLTVDNAADDLDPQDVKAAMESIIDKNVFLSGGGELVGISGARVVDTQIQVLDLE